MPSIIQKFGLYYTSYLNISSMDCNYFKMQTFGKLFQFFNDIMTRIEEEDESPKKIEYSVK